VENGMGHVVAVFVVVMRPNVVHEILMIMEEREVLEKSLNLLKLHEVDGFQSLDFTLASESLATHLHR
jgi:hypothetical protein